MGNVFNQYVTFTKICNEQIALHGRTREAILETIRICKDRNVLREYLEHREREVIDIMMTLYNEEEIMRSYIKSERYDERVETAKEMLRDNEPIEKIMKYSRLPKETIIELQKQEDLQPV